MALSNKDKEKEKIGIIQLQLMRLKQKMYMGVKTLQNIRNTCEIINMNLIRLQNSIRNAFVGWVNIIIT